MVPMVTRRARMVLIPIPWTPACPPLRLGTNINWCMITEYMTEYAVLANFMEWAKQSIRRWPGPDISYIVIYK